MKNLILIISAILISVSASYATINGFVYYLNQVNGAYTVPSGEILVLQQFCVPLGTASSSCSILITPPGSGASTTMQFPSATNGLYTLPKAVLLPAGTIISSSGTVFPAIYGEIIASSDAPLFVGGGSSLGMVAIAANTMTGVLQLPKSATCYNVIFQSSTNLINWAYDDSVMVQPGTDKTKIMFTVPVSGVMRFYRALTRSSTAG